MFGAPFAVAEPNRLAISPILDGKLDTEEWDPLATTADGAKTYFQWEPGKLHAAAVVPNGHDAVFSFDMDSNGWLQGKDNIEVRLSFASGKPVATVRLLDATTVAGPTWRTFPGLAAAASVAASSDATSTTYELTLNDPGLASLPTDAGENLSLRIDDPLSTDAPYEPFVPRLMSPVTLGYYRSAGLPKGVRFAPEAEGRSYVAGEQGHIRLTFNGTNAANLQRLELRTEGPAKNDTNMLAVPFPNFDAKGRSFVDYNTGIRDSASIGFRVLHATLTAGDGVSAILETSYRIAPPIDISLVIKPIPTSDIDRSVKVGFYIHSNSMRPVVGDLTASIPEPFKLVNANARGFEVATRRGRLRENLEVYIPANATGTIPVHFTGEANKTKVDQILYLTIGG
jgi:hypothetical protein